MKALRTDVRSEMRTNGKQGLDDAFDVAKGNFAVDKMMNRDSFWGAGAPAGERGVRRVADAYNVHRGESRNINEALDGIYKNMEGHAAGSDGYKSLERQANALRKYQNSAGRYVDTGMEMGKGALAYMNSGSLAQRAVKYGTAAAGVSAVAGGVRGATSGGNMFYDGDGRKDIAGIPFV